MHSLSGYLYSSLLITTTLIAYLFYKCMKLKQNMYVLVALLLVILYYFSVSYIKGRKGERKLYDHIAFRIVVFALFLYCVYGVEK